MMVGPRRAQTKRSSSRNNSGNLIAPKSQRFSTRIDKDRFIRQEAEYAIEKKGSRWILIEIGTDEIINIFKDYESAVNARKKQARIDLSDKRKLNTFDYQMKKLKRKI